MVSRWYSMVADRNDDSWGLGLPTCFESIFVTFFPDFFNFLWVGNGGFLLFTQGFSRFVGKHQKHRIHRFHRGSICLFTIGWKFCASRYLKVQFWDGNRPTIASGRLKSYRYCTVSNWKFFSIAYIHPVYDARVQTHDLLIVSRLP